MNILVTGGAGFIGSALIRFLIANTKCKILNLDKLSYAGNLQSLSMIENHVNYSFVCADICEKEQLEKIITKFSPDVVMHLAAESHVDNSIENSNDFIQTNIVGTYNLLEVCRKYWCQLSAERKLTFRFHHISTDEVFGELGLAGMFSEQSPYRPSSPYSASKASSDHLVRAWYVTYGLPIIITNCSNNYGAHQFSEKLIPRMILNALAGSPLPVYGNGEQIRDWLYVDDHVEALYKVVTSGVVGETYNIGGSTEKKNIEVVQLICQILEELAPDKPEGLKNYSDLIQYVTDRPGHDFRYAIDASKISTQLGWKAKESFESGLKKTVQWYLENTKKCGLVL